MLSLLRFSNKIFFQKMELHTSKKRRHGLAYATLTKLDNLYAVLRLTRKVLYVNFTLM